MRRVNNLPIVYKKKEVKMRKKKSGVKKFLDRIFRRKERRISAKQRKKIRQELLAEMISDRKEMIIDGQDYDAAVEKFEETMVMKWSTPGGLTTATLQNDILAIRTAQLPEFLLLLGVRIRG